MEDPSTTTLLGYQGFKDDKDERDKLLETYNELLKEHIKSKKVRKQGLESLKKKYKELSMLKPAL